MICPTTECSRARRRRGRVSNISNFDLQRLLVCPKDVRTMQDAADVLLEEKKAHDEDKERLHDMERIKTEIETRMDRLKELTDSLVADNAQLKIQNALLQDEAQRYRAENDELRGQTELLSKRNSDLQDKVLLLRQCCISSFHWHRIIPVLRTPTAAELAAFFAGQASDREL